MAQIMSEFQCLKNKNKILDQLVAIKKFHIEPQVRDSLLWVAVMDKKWMDVFPASIYL